MSLALACGLAGCVTASTPLQTAVPTPKGKVAVQAGATLPIPTRYVRSIADLASDAVDRIDDADPGRPLTDEEQRDALASALGIVLFQPAPVLVVGGRYGVHDDLDVGFRYAGSAVRGDLKWRLTPAEDDRALALDFEATHHLGIGASVAADLFEIFESVNVVDYSRNDLAATLLYSSNTKGRVGFNGAIRYAYSRIGFESELLDEIATESMLGQVSSTSSLHQLGGTAGLRLGNQRFELLLEMTIAKIFFEPEFLGTRIDLGGWLVEPGIAASFRF